MVETTKQMVNQKPRTSVSATTAAPAPATTPRFFPNLYNPLKNLCRPLKTISCVYLRYRKHCGWGSGGGGCGGGGGGWWEYLTFMILQYTNQNLQQHPSQLSTSNTPQLSQEWFPAR